MLCYHGTTEPFDTEFCQGDEKCVRFTNGKNPLGVRDDVADTSSLLFHNELRIARKEYIMGVLIYKDTGKGPTKPPSRQASAIS